MITRGEKQLSTQTTELVAVLNGTLEAVNLIITASMTRGVPRVIQGPLMQTELGVLIGLTHDVRGRLIIEASAHVFSSLGQLMYGMTLEREMLESYVGELGNMLAGNMATLLSSQGIVVEISPPTVLVGETKISGFSTALLIPLTFEGIGELQIILVIEEKQTI